MVKLMRPLPPDMSDAEYGQFLPSMEMWVWALATFVIDDGLLHNPEHAHLIDANVRFLWTNIENARAGRRIVGQCEMPDNMRGGKWSKGRADQQLIEWFGETPDFLITLDAEYCAQCSDAEFCALVEHELLHAGQARDEFGAPKFSKTGRPMFAMRGHDVEEFVSIVRRYGASAAHVSDLVDAANKGPQIAQVKIAQACGTCALRAA